MSYKPVSHTLEEFKKLLLADPQTLQEYESLADEFSLISELIRARKRAGKTQKDIAKTMNTSSSMVSRLESLAGYQKHSPTIETLKKYAQAVNCKLDIRLVPITRHRSTLQKQYSKQLSQDINIGLTQLKMGQKISATKSYEKLKTKINSAYHS